MATTLENDEQEKQYHNGDITNHEDNRIVDGNHFRRSDDPIIACETLRLQNDSLRQELHDIRREMDEVMDQFRTEDAEEFKQLQAELEMAAKNCRILQFKLRKSEKKNENMELEKGTLEDKLLQLTRDTCRVKDLEEELLVAKEVSVRLHAELEKSEEARTTTEKLNMALKQHLDSLKECLDEKVLETSGSSNDDYNSWQLAVNLYESLFREYVLMEEVNWLSNSGRQTSDTSQQLSEISDLLNSYQQKISLLHQEITFLKQELSDRDKDLSVLRVQYKILKRSRSAESHSVESLNQNSNNGRGKQRGMNGINGENGDDHRSRRGVSVDSASNIQKQLESAEDEIRLLKNKMLRLEDELNNSLLEKESLLLKVEESAKSSKEDITEDIQMFITKIESLGTLLKVNQTDEKIIVDLQQLLRTTRWNKQNPDDTSNSLSNAIKMSQHSTEILQQATEFLSTLQSKQDTLEKIRYRLSNIHYDANDTCQLIEELEQTKQEFDTKQQLCQELQITIEQLQTNIENMTKQLDINTTEYEEKLNLKQQETNEQKTKTTEVIQEKTIEINELMQDRERLQTINVKLSHDASDMKKQLDQMKQSILTFEKKLDIKQQRVNELSIKIIEKEDIIETKVKECQKHRLELRELESKYYNLGKELEIQITTMTKEIEKLNIEKEMLKFDLESVRISTAHNHQQTQHLIHLKEDKHSSENDEILRVKEECRQALFDTEIESYKTRINQLTKEKDELDLTIHDMERKFKELQQKYDANEQSWNRSKTDMFDKQRKHEESIKMRNELQNAVDRLRQKLYDIENHSQDKQNRYTIDKNNWELQKLEYQSKINELEEQLSKVTKRQRKDLETAWKKERTDLHKSLQQTQQLCKDLQKQISNKEAPIHLTEKINVLMTENELLTNKIKELEVVVVDVEFVKTEVERLRDKNSSDWHYWRKQQNDLYEQLRLHERTKNEILSKFDKLYKQTKYSENNEGDNSDRLIREQSLPLSLNSFQPSKSSLGEGGDHAKASSISNSNYSRETLADGDNSSHILDYVAHFTQSPNERDSYRDIVGHIDDEVHSSTKQKLFSKAYQAQENICNSLEEIASKIDKVEENLFSYRRFMDFIQIRAKSEKSSSVVRDDSFNDLSGNYHNTNNNKQRLASAPPENNTNNGVGRRSRFDRSGDHHQQQDSLSSNEMTNSTIVNGSSAAPGKNRFFSLSRRFRFRIGSPDPSSVKSTCSHGNNVHFLDEDIDMEDPQHPITKKDKEARPSKGILKTLRHRSPFRFRSKDAIITEQEISNPVTEKVQDISSESKPLASSKLKSTPITTTTPKNKRLVELKPPSVSTTPNAKTVKTKTAATNGTSNSKTNNKDETDEHRHSSNTSLLRRTSGLKDLICKFEKSEDGSTKPPKPKRVTIDINVKDCEQKLPVTVKKAVSYTDLQNGGEGERQEERQRAPPLATKAKTIDIPDLLRNVEKEHTLKSGTAMATLDSKLSASKTSVNRQHSINSSRQTSFDSACSQSNVSEAGGTTYERRKCTSTARPLMLSVNKEES